MRIGILTDFYNEYKLYEKSCIELGVDYVIIDFLSQNWLENINNNLDCDGYMVRPSHDFQEHNDVYMERLYFLNTTMNKKIYPSYNELKLYENKRNMATWLEIHDISHPETKVFLDKKKALKFLDNTEYPVVFKSNTGAGASGVEIVKSKAKANKIMPIIAIDKKYETIFLGPFKSKRYPKGICTLANPKKYPPPKRPNSPADKSNSLINSGEIVAVIALSNVEIK